MRNFPSLDHYSSFISESHIPAMSNPLEIQRADLIMDLSVRLELDETCFQELTDREVYIIYHTYGFRDKESKTLEEVGNIFGVSRQRIHTQRKKAIERIQKACGG